MKPRSSHLQYLALSIFKKASLYVNGSARTVKGTKRTKLSRLAFEASFAHRRATQKAHTQACKTKGAHTTRRVELT
jgi:hypothetical protein